MKRTLQSHNQGRCSMEVSVCGQIAGYHSITFQSTYSVGVCLHLPIFGGKYSLYSLPRKLIGWHLLCCHNQALKSINCSKLAVDWPSLLGLFKTKCSGTVALFILWPSFSLSLVGGASIGCGEYCATVHPSQVCDPGGDHISKWGHN